MILKNNNSKAINRISKRVLKENKAKNIYVLSAIILTTLLLTFVFTAGLTFYKSYSKYMSVVATGIEADGEFILNEEQFNKLIQNDQVVKAGFFRYASEEGLKNKEFLGRTVVVKATQSKEVYDMQFIRPLEGDFPKADNEALLPTWVIESLGAEVKVGEEVTLEMSINGEVKEIKVKVSGYYEPLIPQSAGVGEIFVNNDFLEKYNKEMLNVQGTAYVQITDVSKYSSLEDVEENLKGISSEIDNIEFQGSGRYQTEEEIMVIAEDYSVVKPIMFGVLLVILSGYLLIYNVFYIAVIREIRFYGQLKTLGATSKQIKKIIYKNALILSLIAIPIGLVIGYFLGVILAPEIFKHLIIGKFVIIDKSIYPFILATIFSLLTVYISCRKPSKIAARISPMEATKYNSEDLVKASKKVKKGRHGAKISKMALANIIKNKKKVIISSLSIAISATILIFSMTIWLGLDIDEHIDRYNVADITIEQNIDHSYGEEYRIINSDIIDKIKKIDNVKAVNEYYSLRMTDKFNNASFKVEIDAYGSLKNELDNYNLGYMFNKSSDGRFTTSVSSMKTSELEEAAVRIKVIDGDINCEKFKKGNYIIINRGNQDVKNGVNVGDKVKLTIYNNGKEITDEFEVMAIVGDKDENYTSTNFSTITIEEDKFKSLFTNYKENISSINVDIKDGYEQEVENQIKDILLSEQNDQIALDSKLIWEDGLGGMKRMITSLAIAASIVFGLIGILNVINTIVTNLITRKREFATLEAIGMTKKQQKKLLVYEGLYYLAICMVFIIPLGVTASLLTPNLVPIYGGFNLIGFITTLIVIAIVIGLLMTLVPLISYRTINKVTLVERIKED